MGYAGMRTEWNRDILDKASKILKCARMLSNENKLQYAVEKAVSMGKTVTDRSVPTLLVNFELLECNFELLEWVMEYKEAFCELEQIDPAFKSINFIEEDWDKATALYNCWKGIKDAASSLSDCKYNTANVYFPIVCDIFFKLCQWEKSDNRYVVKIALGLKSCFDEYWSNSNLFLVITEILDPRFKMDVVELWYKMIYGYDAEAQFKKIRHVVTDIFNEYAKGSNSFKSSSIADHGVRNSSTPFKMLDSMGRPCKSSERINDVTLPTSELERYLEDSKFPAVTDFDLLAWWHVNSPAYPTLARMVRDFFAIPVSAPVEYLDSSLATETGNIFYFSNLYYDLRGALACTKIWLHYTSEN
ncbi:zinc finger BED domain-containing protein RICESLEEPER 1-like isoform X1 [Pistacia vera]|uniref:zinc finger BED domain-containing protein RICESLEEPER 1-like isoform X1 n=1 Tax=Pistacia vera TaxID=55513 RepID=UPI001263D348|nr:zinc finger BED domain-containing protein RICESLEEPER 1-like isoform X1 [Pistacia vera]XP_031249044.1 zinc finger BED domain-containing protein RICESLEEPER 1-like isoform X1 [Pistacia vera]XP_031249045.1 zinc finger BED domain-containing protein RICESLEEPER 1-like isoform X1 [Pistacia vera]XP_031249046.1 zinc finger BED domain-containing protein RICESLEEPER 1-like isoform X1 [Pistacia vera]XP_031249047.1 zinc finger BED domain-containing protein RICESLEEPER 1-like isoform X1 [Pistacia vera]